MKTTPPASVLALLLLALAATTPPLFAQPAAPAPAAQAEPSSEVIRLAVENELLRSDSVEGHAIDVTVDNGIVTLSGRVKNLLARRIASRLAQRVHGVQSVINQMEINTPWRDDAEIRKDIEAALHADAATAKLDVKVQVSFSRATLTGGVPSAGLSTLATRVASGVKGVINIDNQLTADAKSRPGDAELQAAIRQLFDYSAILDDVELKVSVKEGNAVLNGIAGSSLQKSYAGDLARDAGATSVDDRGIKVSWREGNPELRSRRYKEATDEQIQAAVLRAFKVDPRLLSYSPQVKVGKGNVILTGDVGVLAAKEAAERDARHTIGVRRVDNHIRVRWPDKPPTDDEIAKFTRDALLRDPYVERHNIIVECRNAHARLYGLVDTEFEKEHAEWTASCQNGVVHVSDYLAVRKEWVPKSDAAIQAALDDKLAYDFVDPNNQVTAKVEDGVAILNGTVDTWLMWQAAMDDAMEAGARRPHNLVKVRYGEPSAPHFYGTHYYIPE
ncbi:MAG: BON domain-containing protein [Chthoniobacteraceae bacterium]